MLAGDLHCEGDGLVFSDLESTTINVDLNGYAIRYVGTGDDTHVGLDVLGTAKITNGAVTGFPYADVSSHGVVELERVSAGSVFSHGGHLTVLHSDVTWVGV